MLQPKNLLTFKEVKTGIDSYYKSIPKSRKTTQTLSVWFEINEIKNYISYLEKKSKDKGIDISGIRVHLISENDTSKKINLAFCPTVELNNKKGKKIHPSFDPNYSEKGSPALLVKLMNDDEYADKTSSVLNRGDICPYICPEII